MTRNMSLEIHNRLQSKYKSDLRNWIITSVDGGVEDLWQLIAEVPGVYPTVVRDTSRLLVQELVIPGSVISEGKSRGIERAGSREVPGMDVASPLAFDWRFTYETAEELLRMAVKSTRQNESIALLGDPFTLQTCRAYGYPPTCSLVRQESILE